MNLYFDFAVCHFGRNTLFNFLIQTYFVDHKQIFVIYALFNNHAYFHPLYCYLNTFSSMTKKDISSTILLDYEASLFKPTA